MTRQIQTFLAAANNSPEASSLLLSGTQEVRPAGPWRTMFTWRATHRRAISEFWDALKMRFGDGIANMAGDALGARWQAGRPLTAETVRRIISEAKAIDEQMLRFYIGVDPMGAPYEHSLDAALDAWFATHPRPRLEEAAERAERDALKRAVFSTLQSGCPPCHSIEEMAAAVRQGRVAPLAGLVALEQACCQETAMQEVWQTVLNTAHMTEQETAAVHRLSGDASSLTLSPSDVARLQGEIRARLSAACRGGAATLPDEQAAQAVKATLNLFLANLRNLAAADLDEASRQLLRQEMFREAGPGIARILSTEEDLVAAIARCRCLAANASLVKEVVKNIAQSMVPALTQRGIACMFGNGSVQVKAPLPTNPKALDFQEISRATREALIARASAAISGCSDHVMTEDEAKGVLAATVAAWADGIAAALAAAQSQDVPAQQAMGAYLMCRQLRQPELVGADYVRTMLDKPPEIGWETLSTLLSATALERWEDALEAVGSKPAAALATLDPALAERPEIRAAVADDAVILGVLSLGLSPTRARDVYERLDDVWGTAFKSSLILASSRADEARAPMLLEIADRLHQALGFQLGVPSEQERAAFANFPVVEREEDLPLPLRPANAPRFVVDADIPLTPETPATIRARLDEKQKDLAKFLSEQLVDEVTKHLQQQQGLLNPDAPPAWREIQPQFQKDQKRDSYVIVGSRRLTSHDPAEVPAGDQVQAAMAARRVAEQGYAEFARFLFGEEADFTSLTAAEQRQVFILAGLCNQGLEYPLTELAVKPAIAKPLIDEAIILGLPQGAKSSRNMHLSRGPQGEVTLTYGCAIPYAQYVPPNTIGFELDAQKSRLEARTEIVITAEELARLGNLAWDPQRTTQALLAEIQPRIEVRALDGCLTLALPEEAEPPFAEQIQQLTMMQPDGKVSGRGPSPRRPPPLPSQQASLRQASVPSSPPPTAADDPQDAKMPASLAKPKQPSSPDSTPFDPSSDSPPPWPYEIGRTE